MSLHREARPIFRRAFFLTVLVLACRSDSTTGPGDTPQVIAASNLTAVVCTATPSTRTLSCASPSDPANRGPSLSYGLTPGSTKPSNAIFGGNHTNVDVTTSNIINDVPNHHFSFDLQLKNLSIRPIGTTDGISSDGSLSLFFHSGPTTTGGTGIVTVFNPTGIGTFTAAGQPYFNYGEMLAQNQTSASKNWVLDYAPTVTTFDFILLISASLQFPDGYIDVYPDAGAVVVPGGTFQLQDTVRNGLGAVNSLQKVAWSSSDPSVATVDTLGLVKGVKLGSVTITATQSVKIGTAIVQVLPPTPPSAANDTTTSSSEPGDPFHAFFNTVYERGAPGVLANDNRGAPLATVTSFGGDSLGGLVTDHAAGSPVSPLPGHADGSLQINVNGSVSFTPPTGFTGYYRTSYRISNGVGTSDATVRLAVGERPSVSTTVYGPHLRANVGINTANSTQTKVSATGDGLSYTVLPDTLGNATIHSDGTFEYSPKVGKIGAAAFTFHVSNGFGTTTNAKVSLTIDGPRIWFVDSAVAAGGDGRYGSPFNCIMGASCAQGVAAPGDIIHVRRGTYLNPAAWPLSFNSRVIGEGASGLFSDAANANVTWPADAGAQPATGGTRPIINSAGLNVMVAGSNTVTRGLILGNSTLASLATFGGPLTISDVAIVNGVAGALSLQGAGALNISLDSIKTGPTAASATIALSNVQGTVNSSLTKIIAPLEGVTIGGGNASVNLGAGFIQSPNAEAVKIVQSAASFSFAGTISNSLIPVSINGVNQPCGTISFSGAVKSTQRGIDIRNCTSGSVTFSGPDTLSTGAFRAISILNSSAPVAFTGGALSATTTAANAFFARNAVVSVVFANNSLSSAGAPALVLDTVSTSGLTFRSISATGGTTGVLVRNTSGTGGLTVTGAAGGLCGGDAGLAAGFLPPIVADCTGGTIQGMTGTFPDGVGVYLENTKSISLGKMRIRDNVNFGVAGDSVAGFAMGRDYVSNNGLSTAGEGTGNIYLRGLIGTGSIDATFVDSGAVANVFVEDTVGTLNFSMNGAVIGNDGASTGRRGVVMRAQNSNINASIQNSRFLGSRQVGAHVLVVGSSIVDFVFTGNVMSNNHPAVLAGHNAVVVEGSGTAGSVQPVVTYDISSNTINNNTSANLSGDVIVVFKGAADNGHFRGIISGNKIGSGVSKSGSALGSGIAVKMTTSGADTVNILNNNIKNTAIDGITISNQAPTSAGSLVATLTGNNINTPELTSLNPISFILGGPSSAGKNCVTIGGAGVLANTITYSSILLSVRTSTPVGLPGLVGDPGAYIAARNNGALSTISLFAPASLSGTCP